MFCFIRHPHFIAPNRAQRQHFTERLQLPIPSTAATTGAFAYNQPATSMTIEPNRRPVNIVTLRGRPPSASSAAQV